MRPGLRSSQLQPDRRSSAAGATDGGNVVHRCCRAVAKLREAFAVVRAGARGGAAGQHFCQGLPVRPPGADGNGGLVALSAVSERGAARPVGSSGHVTLPRVLVLDADLSPGAGGSGCLACLGAQPVAAAEPASGVLLVAEATRRGELDGVEPELPRPRGLAGVPVLRSSWCFDDDDVLGVDGGDEPGRGHDGNGGAGGTQCVGPAGRHGLHLLLGVQHRHQRPCRPAAGGGPARAGQAHGAVRLWGWYSDGNGCDGFDCAAEGLRRACFQPRASCCQPVLQHDLGGVPVQHRARGRRSGPGRAEGRWEAAHGLFHCVCRQLCGGDLGVAVPGLLYLHGTSRGVGWADLGIRHYDLLVPRSGVVDGLAQGQPDGLRQGLGRCQPDQDWGDPGR
eukprot:RCo002274